MSNPLFVELNDSTQVPYFALVPSYPTPPPSTARDICSFLCDEMHVSRRVTGPFSSDLTAADDVLIAVLSLLLLLAIEGVVTALLLRTREGSLSNFGFSVRQFSELARELKIGHIIRGRGNTRPDHARARWNHRLVFVAVFVFVFTFGLQVLVLFLTNLDTRRVTNNVATFRLAEPVAPDWEQIRDGQESLNQPCTAVSLVGVEQGVTRISACLTSNVGTGGVDVFDIAEDLEFHSELHEFGSEHSIRVGDRTGNYSARAYFRLQEPDVTGNDDPGGERLMPKVDLRRSTEELISAVHKTYIALLYTANNRAQNVGARQNLALEQLNAVQFNFSMEEGGMVDVVRTNVGKIVLQSPSRRYITKARGVIPGGRGALLFAQPLLKAAVAVAVEGPNPRDLMMASGNTYPRVGVLWEEEYRSLNWLSLTLVLCLMLALLVVLRCSLKPVVMSELAGMYVSGATRGGFGGVRDPVEVVQGERERFRVEFIGRTAEAYADFGTNGESEAEQKKSRMKWRLWWGTKGRSRNDDPYIDDMA